MLRGQKEVRKGGGGGRSSVEPHVDDLPILREDRGEGMVGGVARDVVNIDRGVEGEGGIVGRKSSHTTDEVRVSFLLRFESPFAFAGALVFFKNSSEEIGVLGDSSQLVEGRRKKRKRNPTIFRLLHLFSQESVFVQVAVAEIKPHRAMYFFFHLFSRVEFSFFISGDG